MVKRIITAFFGFLLGVTTFVAVAGGFVVLATPQTEAQSGQSCFKKGECLEGDTSIKCGPEGCCNGTRCFLPDSSCNTTGNTTDNGRCYVKSQPVKLTFSIGNKETVLDLGDYIAAVYTYAVSVAGIFAIVMMMIGGFQWMTARDNPQIAQDAKERISNALIGLAITLFAFIVLNTVNPDIVLLRLPKVEVIKRSEFAIVSCENTGLCFGCGEEYGVKLIRGPGETKGGQIPQQGDCSAAAVTTNLNDQDVVAKCIGTGCQKKDGSCSDANHKCVAAQQGASTTFCQEEASANQATGALSTTVAGAGGVFSYVCKACRPNGSSCSQDGRNDACCGGYCNDGACGTGELGEQCNSDASCKSGKCVGVSGITSFGQGIQEATAVASGICSNGKPGAYCDDANDCSDANGSAQECIQHVCTNTAYAKAATLASQIYTYSNALGNDYNAVIPFLKTLPENTLLLDLGDLGSAADGADISIGGPTIKVNEDINNKTSGYGEICIEHGADGNNCSPAASDCLEIAKLRKPDGTLWGIGVCSTNRLGDICDLSSSCVTKSCTTYSPIKSARYQTNPSLPSLGMCNDGAIGDFCGPNRDCKSNRCATVQEGTGVCSTGLIGSICSDNASCDPGLTCKSNRCLP